MRSSRQTALGLGAGKHVLAPPFAVVHEVIVIVSSVKQGDGEGRVVA